MALSDQIDALAVALGADVGALRALTQPDYQDRSGAAVTLRASDLDDIHAIDTDSTLGPVAASHVGRRIVIRALGDIAIRGTPSTTVHGDGGAGLNDELIARVIGENTWWLTGGSPASSGASSEVTNDG